MKSRWLRKLLLIFLSVAPAVPDTVFGHTTGLSTADLQFGTNGLGAELTLAGSDMTAALAHVETARPLDANHDGRITQDEFIAGLEQLKSLAAGALIVEFDGQRIPPSAPGLALDEQDNFHIFFDLPRGASATAFGAGHFVQPSTGESSAVFSGPRRRGKNARQSNAQFY